MANDRRSWVWIPLMAEINFCHSPVYSAHTVKWVQGFQWQKSFIEPGGLGPSLMLFGCNQWLHQWSDWNYTQCAWHKQYTHSHNICPSPAPHLWWLARNWNRNTLAGDTSCISHLWEVCTRCLNAVNGQYYKNLTISPNCSFNLGY